MVSSDKIQGLNGGEIRNAGCPCRHYQLSCVSRHRFSSIPKASNGSIVPAPTSHARHHRRDPQSRKSRAAALALLRASENDIGEGDDGDVIIFGVPFATSPGPIARNHPAAMQVETVALSGSCVARHVGDSLRPPSSGTSSELSASWAFLLLFAPLLFAERVMARGAPIALRQRMHGSKFSRRSQRSCLIGAAKILSHV